jgi:hypothetical protein
VVDDQFGKSPAALTLAKILRKPENAEWQPKVGKFFTQLRARLNWLGSVKPNSRNDFITWRGLIYLVCDKAKQDALEHFSEAPDEIKSFLLNTVSTIFKEELRASSMERNQYNRAQQAAKREG